ncbi:hypothetical protein D1Z98_09885 [Riemerella anatipestifer]|uniref:DUF6705 family protein n=1 Tax=Riemerella anatipestifer TaxID=34085 RepID=UPI00129E6E09|nr:DUF6705 family protein [Riemerella anatipestifer]MRM95256.1 hypothetical protein [Riemerella anatipestifer]
MKKILLLVIVLLLHTNCTAQNVYPLNTSTSTLKLPLDSYIKDLGNEFAPYVGTWKAIHNGNTITLDIKKQVRVSTKYFDKSFFRDLLFISYEVRDINGRLLESTLGKGFTIDSKNKIEGLTIDRELSRVNCIYYGKQCSLGNGFVYLKKQGNNQLLWSYYPQAILVTSQNEKECKGEIYLPEGENIVFTRQ